MTSPLYVVTHAQRERFEKNKSAMIYVGFVWERFEKNKSAMIYVGFVWEFRRECNGIE